jgi:hypothetical protein
LVQPRYVAHHFVAHKFQTEAHVATTLSFVNRAHALSNLFLAALCARKNPDAQESDDNDEERQDRD